MITFAQTSLLDLVVQLWYELVRELVVSPFFAGLPMYLTGFSEGNKLKLFGICSVHSFQRHKGTKYKAGAMPSKSKTKGRKSASTGHATLPWVMRSCPSLRSPWRQSASRWRSPAHTGPVALTRTRRRCSSAQSANTVRFIRSMVAPGVALSRCRRWVRLAPEVLKFVKPSEIHKQVLGYS